jgi:hypothetical protein
MAVRTVSTDAGMIKVCGQPCHGGMTIVTIIAARNVCRVLANGRYAVVTRPAGPDYLRVIDSESRRP